MWATLGGVDIANKFWIKTVGGTTFVGLPADLPFRLRPPTDAERARLAAHVNIGDSWALVLESGDVFTMRFGE